MRIQEAGPLGRRFFINSRVSLGWSDTATNSVFEGQTIKVDEREILEDLLVSAHNDARRKAEAAMQEKMQALTGGLGLPPGLGLG